MKKHRRLELLRMLSIFDVFLIVVYQLLYNIYPFRQFVERIHLDWVSPALAVLGSLLLIGDLFWRKNFYKAKYVYCLLATLVILCISSMMNLQYSIVNNAKSIIWQAVQMLLIYPLCYQLTQEEKTKLLRAIYLTISIPYAIACIVSIYQLVRMISYQIEGVTQGVFEGHLFGVFASVFFAGVANIVLAYWSIYGMLCYKEHWLKIWCGITAVLALLYAIMTDSRSVFVACAIATAIMAFFFLRNWLYRKKTQFGGICIYTSCTLIMVVTVVVVIAGMNVIHRSVDSIPSLIQPPSYSVESVENVLNRDDLHNGDISNNRFHIWKDYFDVTTRDAKTTLLGLSPANYMQAIQDSAPELYIAQFYQNNRPDRYAQGEIYDVHSGYLSIFVMGGLMSVLTLGVFLLCCVVKVASRFFATITVSRERIICLGSIIAIMVATIFDSDLFFRCTGTSVLFWLFAGFLMSDLTTEGEGMSYETKK